MQHHPNQELHKFIEARMKKQQEDSEKDAKWLWEQEENIKKRLSISSLNDLQLTKGDSNGSQIVAGKPPQPANERAPLSPKLNLDQTQPSTSSSSSITSPQEGIKKTDPKSIDRQNDPIYKHTTNVVRSVMTLSSGVEKSTHCEYLELVKTVGLELRNLLGIVDHVSANFPPQTHKYENH